MEIQLFNRAAQSWSGFPSEVVSPSSVRVSKLEKQLAEMGLGFVVSKIASSSEIVEPQLWSSTFDPPG